MSVRRDEPYLYPTWLAKLMSGEVSCEWAVWFRVHHKDWVRPPSDFDEAKYTLEHTRLAREMRAQRDTTRETLLVERQSAFWYTHPSGIRISGRPDLVSLSPAGNCIYEAKAFAPRPWHRLQVMIYMYCLPRSENARFYGKSFSGMLHYADRLQPIRPEELEGAFEEHLDSWLRLLAGPTPLEKFPSEQECRFCNIGKADCPERLAEVASEDA